MPVVMSTKLASILELNSVESEALEKPAANLTSLSEWFTETIEAVKETPIFEHLGSFGEAAKEWSSTVKAIGKLIEKFTKERSPLTLGWLACTIAYRRAATEAIRQFGRPAARIPFSGQVASDRLKNLRLEDPSIMERFSLTSASAHPFVRAADEGLLVTLEIAGYDQAERRNLLRTVRGSFKATLQELLSGESKEKFAAFTQWLQLDTDDQRLDAALLAYGELQRSELEDQPVLGIVPFAVNDIYIETQCGTLEWRRIRDELTDPFSEKSAARKDLLLTVSELLSDPTFKDCIVIQGAPGAGKSTFTKKLSTRLQSEGLIPIRIPLQHLRVDLNLFDAVQDVVARFSGKTFGTFRRDILAERVFSEKVPFGRADISPYVFIFDGWDEISLSAAEGFQQRIHRLLDSIRQTFLNQNRNAVRVVLTGRPSSAVSAANFLLDSTPILTVRPIRPD